MRSVGRHLDYFGWVGYCFVDGFKLEVEERFSFGFFF